jgi:hypothetical protein
MRGIPKLLVVAWLACQSPTALAAEEDRLKVFVNDNGVECVIMIDFAEGPAYVEPMIRWHMGEILRSDRLSQCEPTAEPVLIAIHIKEFDHYGQPKWASVAYLAEYTVNREKLRALLSSGASDSELGAALVPAGE